MVAYPVILYVPSTLVVSRLYRRPFNDVSTRTHHPFERTSLSNTFSFEVLQR